MDFLLEYKEYLFLLGLNFLISGVYIYIPTQAIVYVFGRMLKIAEKDEQRNFIALLSTIIFSIGYIFMRKEFPTIKEYVWEFFHWFSLGIMWYVLLGFKLFSRVDSFMDVKFAKDKPEKKRK